MYAMMLKGRAEWKDDEHSSIYRVIDFKYVLSSFMATKSCVRLAK